MNEVIWMQNEFFFANLQQKQLQLVYLHRLTLTNKLSQNKPTSAS